VRNFAIFCQRSWFLGFSDAMEAEQISVSISVRWEPDRNCRPQRRGFGALRALPHGRSRVELCRPCTRPSKIVLESSLRLACLSTPQRVARNVKRWREGSQPLRWTAIGLLEAEKRFRRIKSYQEILLLKERLNPSRIQQKEVRTLEVA
jgi:hypothetical protein